VDSALIPESLKEHVTRMSKITGILRPHMVPLDERGQINEPELRRYVDWLISRGVDGLYPNGSTGEFIRFTLKSGA